ncbi:hypothetical protein [Alysiella crassa]|uniref:Uncharacterized protein n=1 Tax=Alysiella crassa TaxID=153491 RepID=A0A376BVT9_9NEIS|nr:hypothetical protein [Alysiella crassa]UOP06527.1 hypothetical protein LVJ80_12325 [Alysiella crassa]SSY81060.1 Uncharacterised protein [Alysiella crassa]
MTTIKPEKRQEYESRRMTKKVSFNIQTEFELIQFTERVDFSKWVKEKIRHELELEKIKK